MVVAAVKVASQQATVSVEVQVAGTVILVELVAGSAVAAAVVAKDTVHIH